MAPFKKEQIRGRSERRNDPGHGNGDQIRCEAADRDRMDTDNLIFLVKHQDNEVFPVCISKILL